LGCCLSLDKKNADAQSRIATSDARRKPDSNDSLRSGVATLGVFAKIFLAPLNK